MVHIARYCKFSCYLQSPLFQKIKKYYGHILWIIILTINLYSNKLKKVFCPNKIENVRQFFPWAGQFSGWWFWIVLPLSIVAEITVSICPYMPIIDRVLIFFCILNYSCKKLTCYSLLYNCFCTNLGAIHYVFIKPKMLRCHIHYLWKNMHNLLFILLQYFCGRKC